MWQDEIPAPVCFQNTLLRYRAVEGVSVPAFVMHWCLWAYESGQFREAADGTSIKHIGSVLRLLRGHKEFRDHDGVWHALKVIDFEHPAANMLVVSDEVTITIPGKTSRRFDLVYWVNGLPLVVVEVKSPTSESGWERAAREVNDVYAAEYPWFFTPNVFAVASDGLKLRFGAVGAPTNLWAPFRSTADDEHLSGQADVQRSAELLMNPATVLDILANFALFDTSGGGADRKYLPFTRRWRPRT